MVPSGVSGWGSSGAATGLPGTSTRAPSAGSNYRRSPPPTEITTPTLIDGFRISLRRPRMRLSGTRCTSEVDGNAECHGCVRFLLQIRTHHQGIPKDQPTETIRGGFGPQLVCLSIPGVPRCTPREPRETPGSQQSPGGLQGTHGDPRASRGGRGCLGYPGLVLKQSLLRIFV